MAYDLLLLKFSSIIFKIYFFKDNPPSAHPEKDIER